MCDGNTIIGKGFHMTTENTNKKILRFPLTADDLRRAGDAAKEDARRAKRRNRRALTLITALLIVAVISFAFAAFFGKAKGSSGRVKKLTSVYVEKGDSLWSIAEEYYTPECGNMKDYIREIRATNSLDSNTIRYGYTLLVPYYE